MNWLARWFESPVALDAASRQRMSAWVMLPEPAMQQPLTNTRWVVVDTETSGLNPRRDSLISIGACQVTGNLLDLGRSFYTLIRQSQVSSTENVLIHGIGHAEQVSGTDYLTGLTTYLEFCRRDVLVAYHAAFDEAMLRTAMQRHLSLRFRPVWIDVAKLADVLFPVEGRHFRMLDEWLAHFSIEHPARHHALADAFCTAQLLLVLLAKAQERGLQTLRRLIQAERSHQWLKY